MRSQLANADRFRAVRRAAKAWRQAGAIDEATLKAIVDKYPDDRARLGPTFRVVAFVFGLFALNAFFGVIGMCTSTFGAFGVSCLFFGLLLFGATEILLGPLKRADSGIETATALLFVIYEVVGMGLVINKAFSPSDHSLFILLLGAGAVLSTLGSVRWGSSLLAVVASLCVVLFLTQLPLSRLLWVVLSLLLAPALLRGAEAARLPPAHRRSLQLCLVVTLCACYLAIHIGVWDAGLFEALSRSPRPPATALRPLSIVATSCLPLLVMIFGVLTRRTYLIGLGVVLGVASLVTLRAYVALAPVWIVLIGSGLAALLVTLATKRLLESGRNKERGGLTAEPLFDDPARYRAAEMVAAIATFSPETRTETRDSLEPGGGRFGGGGASGDF